MLIFYNSTRPLIAPSHSKVCGSFLCSVPRSMPVEWGSILSQKSLKGLSQRLCISVEDTERVSTSDWPTNPWRTVAWLASQGPCPRLGIYLSDSWYSSSLSFVGRIFRGSLWRTKTDRELCLLLQCRKPSSSWNNIPHLCSVSGTREDSLQSCGSLWWCRDGMQT